MPAATYLQFSHKLGICTHSGAYGYSNQQKSTVRKGRVHLSSFSLSSQSMRQDTWSLHLSDSIYQPFPLVPSRYNVFICRSFFRPGQANEILVLKAAALALRRSCNSLHGSLLAVQLAPAVGIIAFALWGLGPLMHQSRYWFLHRNDSNWKSSSTHYVFTSYIRPLLLWTGVTLICRVLDPVILLSETSQVIKLRLLNFVRSLSTVLAFAYCLSRLILWAQKFFMESNDSNDARNMGFQFAGKALYTAVWVAAVSLFMELLGFSTQKWITAGGLGTVLITLAGREILTNFLSSVMIHATRPFVVNEWIQTTIEGYEVSGCVEHVGWWSPTIIRGDDREAVHIPNHKFTVNVVRNLSQKTHWRIKTHIAISHLDVNKINNIVADMRKVLAKNPQVEQQRLHRRVFLDNIDPENQALMILVSCFVKTSHVEEYLCVKEAILLDLLRVVRHHRARLATPIRTVQKIYADTEMENVSFSETIFTRARAATNRPFLLIEPPSRINSDDNAKARSMQLSEENLKAAVVSDSKDETSSPSDGPVKNSSDLKQSKKENSDVHLTAKTDGSSVAIPASTQPPNLQPEGQDLGGLNAEDNTIQRAAPEKPSVLSEPGNEKSDNSSPGATTHLKHESEKLPVARPSNARSTLEDNIVLGVALEGSKRMLPIELGMAPSLTAADVKELAACRNSNGTSSTEKESQISSAPGVVTGDQRDQER